MGAGRPFITFFRPEIYRDIANKLEVRRTEREQLVERFIAKLQKNLNQLNVKSEVSGRAKHIYSIYNKMRNKNLSSGQMKEFFDSFYYDLLGKVEGRHYSAIIAAGSDGAGALKQLERICTGWRLNQAVPAIILNTASSSEEEIRAQKQLSPEQIVRAEEIGSTLIALMST
ncbi:hypothetical protein OURE66S_03725 [Oligella ureolytica]